MLNVELEYQKIKETVEKEFDAKEQAELKNKNREDENEDSLESLGVFLAFSLFFLYLFISFFFESKSISLEQAKDCVKTQEIETIKK